MRIKIQEKTCENLYFQNQYEIHSGVEGKVHYYYYYYSSFLRCLD
jgi:hypothetical protein